MRLHKLTSQCSRLLATFILLCALPLPNPVQANGIGDFIVGGQTVGSDSKYPFMASIKLQSFFGNTFSHACGGSLIAPQWILTAAHCVNDLTFARTYDPSEVRVGIGSTNLTSANHNVIEVEEIISHPDYDIDTVQNDIALIKLASPFPSPLAVLPVQDSPIPVVEESGIVIGWGALIEGGRSTNRLREVALPVVSNASCFPYYPLSLDTRLSFCAAGERAGGRDSCTGDSGGPLLSIRDNFYVVSGLISFGEGCARPDVPGAYTRVAAYTDWIVSNTTGTLSYGAELIGQSADNTVITRLDVNNSSTNSLLEGDVAYYDVSNSRQVNLTSNSGDADLFMINDGTFQKISLDLLACYSGRSVGVDTCVVNQNADGAYAVVFGTTDTEYTISTQSIVTDDSSTRPFFSGADSDSIQTSSAGASMSFLWLALMALWRRSVLRRAV